MVVVVGGADAAPQSMFGTFCKAVNSLWASPGGGAITVFRNGGGCVRLLSANTNETLPSINSFVLERDRIGYVAGKEQTKNDQIEERSHSTNLECPGLFSVYLT